MDGAAQPQKQRLRKHRAVQTSASTVFSATVHIVLVHLSKTTL
jgi:hypothetical protein